MNILIPVLALLLPGISFAESGGANISGGGNAVVCFHEPATADAVRANRHLSNRFLEADLVESIEIYDLFEARLRAAGEGRRVVEYLSTLSASQFVDNIQFMMDVIAPRIGVEFERIAAGMGGRDVIQHPFGLKPIRDYSPDPDYPVDSSRCVVATMGAHQIDGDSFLLHVDARLYHHEKHSSLSRGVFLLHEWMYMLARRRGHTDSRNTRRLIYEFIAWDSDATVGDVLDRAHRLGFMDDPPAKTDLQPAYLIELILEDAFRRIENAIDERLDESRRYHAENNLVLSRYGSACEDDTLNGCIRAYRALLAENPENSELRTVLGPLEAYVETEIRLIQSSVLRGYTDHLRPRLRQMPYGTQRVRGVLDYKLVNHFFEERVREILLTSIGTRPFESGRWAGYARERVRGVASGFSLDEPAWELFARFNANSQLSEFRYTDVPPGADDPGVLP